MPSFQGSTAQKSRTTPFGDVVEIGLLLPADRVEQLVRLSGRRRLTVAQLLRSLIDDALADEAPQEAAIPPALN